MPLPPIPIKNIRDHLPLLKLEVLRRAYVRADAVAVLNAVLPATYDNALQYAQAVADAFYGNLPEDTSSGWRTTLSVQDRERCIITLLASRRAELELAIHIYLALMESVSIDEVANILMLTGMYSGLDTFSRGLRVEAKVLDTLAAIVDQNKPKDAVSVLIALSQAFEPAPAS